MANWQNINLKLILKVDSKIEWQLNSSFSWQGIKPEKHISKFKRNIWECHTHQNHLPDKNFFFNKPVIWSLQTVLPYMRNLIIFQIKRVFLKAMLMPREESEFTTTCSNPWFQLSQSYTMTYRITAKLGDKIIQ